MENLKGVDGVQIEHGFSAVCPTCGKNNKCFYGKDGRLVYCPNAEIGEWCIHSRGFYESGKTPEALFVFPPPIYRDGKKVMEWKNGRYEKVGELKTQECKK